ncbi:hypothetical protein J7K74_03865, partial [Candidatus Woesearchaeota archaeon]|nr:hypothetical protein [Candidatus Woesearchaeota archaeon]
MSEMSIGALAKALRAAGIAGSDVAAEMMARSMLNTNKKVQREFEEKKLKVAMWNIGKEEIKTINGEIVKKEEGIKKLNKEKIAKEREELNIFIKEPETKPVPLGEEEIEKIKKIEQEKEIDPEQEKEIDPELEKEALIEDGERIYGKKEEKKDYSIKIIE